MARKDAKARDDTQAARLERTRGKTIRYVRILRRGNVVSVAEGKVGEDEDDDDEQAHGDAGLARAAFEAEVAAWQAKGYEIVPTFPEPGSTGLRGRAVHNPDLAAAIAREPDSFDAWQVYADWLTSQGDVRGELATVQLWRKRRPHDGRLSVIETKLLAGWGRELLGPLAARGSISVGGSGLLPAFRWRNGFLRAVRLWRDADRPTLAELVDTLLEHPAGHLVEHIVLGRSRWEDETDYEEVVDALARKAPQTFHALTIGESEDARPGNLEPALRLPGLRKLRVHHTPLELGDVGASTLEELALDLASPSPTLVESLCDATWPSLRSLSIVADVAASVGPMLAGVAAPRLEKLVVTGADGDFFRFLARRPVLSRLRELELWWATGLEVLIELAADFRHLSSLRVQRTASWWTSSLGGRMRQELPGFESFSAKHEPDALDLA